MRALLSVPLPYLVLCVVVPLGSAVRLHDIFIRRTTVTPQPDGIVSARWALTLSSAIVVSEELPGEVCSQAVLLQQPHQSARCTTLVFSVRSISGHTILCNPKPLPPFFFTLFLLTLIIALLHLQCNLTFCAYRAALLRLYSRFQSPTHAPEVHLPDRAGLS